MQSNRAVLYAQKVWNNLSTT